MRKTIQKQFILRSQQVAKIESSIAVNGDSILPHYMSCVLHDRTMHKLIEIFSPVLLAKAKIYMY